MNRVVIRAKLIIVDSQRNGPVTLRVIDPTTDIEVELEGFINTRCMIELEDESGWWKSDESLHILNVVFHHENGIAHNRINLVTILCDRQSMGIHHA